MAIEETNLDPAAAERHTEVIKQGPGRAVVQTGIGPADSHGVLPDSDRMSLNLGPQHPSTHGVLRVLLELDGEVVLKCIPDLGYLHRGIEKIGEYRQYNQFVPIAQVWYAQGLP